MRYRKIILFLFVSILLWGMIAEVESVNTAVKDAVILCFEAVIPALFPFFVISTMMVNTGMISVLGKFFSPVSRVLFRTSGKGAVVFLIGILCGYPTGAKVVADGYSKGEFDKNEAERLLAFCNNSGPLFVIGTVGCAMLADRKAGIVLYVIHVISAILCGVSMGIFSKKKTVRFHEEIVAVNFSKSLSESVERAVVSILNVCGYVVFFACVTTILNKYIPNPVFLSLVEVTQGAKAIIGMNYPPDMTLVLLSGAIGFGGVCVAFQVKGVTASAGLSTKKYLLGKVFQMCVSMIVTKLYVRFFDTVSAFAPLSTTQRTFQAAYIVSFLFLLCGIFTVYRLTKKR